MEGVRNGLERLLAAMERELELLDALIAAAQEKQTLLALADVDALALLLTRETETAAALHEAEGEREAAAAALAHTLGLPESSPSIDALAERLEDPELRRSLAAARRKTALAVGTLFRQNARAGALVEQKLRYTDFMLHLLCAPPGQAQLYNMQGAREDSVMLRSRLDYQA